jgi:hypothetical protein
MYGYWFHHSPILRKSLTFDRLIGELIRSSVGQAYIVKSVSFLPLSAVNVSLFGIILEKGGVAYEVYTVLLIGYRYAAGWQPGWGAGGAL